MRILGIVESADFFQLCDEFFSLRLLFDQRDEDHEFAGEEVALFDEFGHYGLPFLEFAAA